MLVMAPNLLTLSAAGGWDLSAVSYESKSFNFTSEDTNGYLGSFKPDGTKFYLVGSTSATVYEYDLSTAWDIDTASYNSKSFGFTSQQETATGLFFKSDGTKFYLIGNNTIGLNTTDVHQYSLSTAWDISSASFDNKEVSVDSQQSSAFGLFFKPDGTKFYIIGFGNSAGEIHQYGLSTTWDVDTASYDSVVVDISSETTLPVSLVFKEDGTRFFIFSFDEVARQYDLSIAWDITTATHDSSADFDASTEVNNARGLLLGKDGGKLYLGASSDDVYQYSLE